MPRPRTCSPARCCGMRGRSRAGARAGAARRPQAQPTVTLLGEMFPADPVGIGMMLEPLGLAAGPVVPTREWRELYARWIVRWSRPSILFIPPAMREFEQCGPAGRRVRTGGCEGTAAWLAAIGEACGVAGTRVGAAQESHSAGDPARARGNADQAGASRCPGYEGSELLVARLLIESGAEVRYVGTACPRTLGRTRS